MGLLQYVGGTGTERSVVHVDQVPGQEKLSTELFPGRLFVQVLELAVGKLQGGCRFRAERVKTHGRERPGCC